MQTPERAFAYERWANRRVLEHLRSLPDPPARGCELLAHILAALEVWMTRIEGRDSNEVVIWPALALTDCESKLTAVETAMTAALTKLQTTTLDSEIRYTNQHGLSYATSIRDILFHLSSHGAYHRGQIATALRGADLEPVNTDYITFVRELAGQPWKP